MTDIKFEKGNVIIKSESFDLRQTLDCGQAFRFSKSEEGVWSGIVNKRILKLFQNGNTVTLYNVSKNEFNNYFYNYFTLDIDYGNIKKILSSDETLKKATEISSGLRLLRQDKFETICSFIFSQNNNIPRIKGIINRFCENFGEEIENGSFAFPTAEKIASLSVDDLLPIRAGFRAKYIVDAAQKIHSKQVDLEKLDNISIEKAREMLMSVKGIGPKVAECILLFCCGRFEAFPVDVWIKKVMSVLYPNGLPKCTKGIEGIAQQYLFDYARTIKL